MKYEKLKKNYTKNIIIGLIVIIIIGSVLALNITKAKYRTTTSINIVNGTIKYSGSNADLNVMAVYQQKEQQTCTEENCYDNKEDIPTKGYKLNKITVTYEKDGKETEVKVAEDGTFVMPEGAVKVNVTFVKIEVPVDNKPDEAPATFDNVLGYVVLTFGVLGTAIIVSKKVLTK